MAPIQRTLQGLLYAVSALQLVSGGAIPGPIEERDQVGQARAAIAQLNANQFCSSFLHLHDTTKTVTRTTTDKTTYVTVSGAPCSTVVAGKTSTVTRTTFVPSTSKSTQTLAASTTVRTSSLAGPTVRTTKTLDASTETDFTTLTAETSTVETDLPASTVIRSSTATSFSGATQPVTSTDATSRVSQTARTSTVQTVQTTVVSTFTSTVQVVATSTIFRKRDAEAQVTQLAKKSHNTGSGARCRVAGLPHNLDVFVCDVISDACSLLVHPRTVTTTTSVCANPVTVRTTKPASCVTRTAAGSTITVTATSTSLTRLTVSSQPPASTRVTSVTGPATTQTDTSQLPPVTTRSTSTPPAVTVTTTSQIPASTSDVTVTVTIPSTTTVTIDATAVETTVTTETDAFTETATVTATATSLVTTTTTSRTTSVAPIQTGLFGCRPTYRGDSGFVTLAHDCGLDDSCFCVPQKETHQGTCTSGNQGCGPSCTTNAQCSDGQTCLIGLDVCGGPDDGHCEITEEPQCANPTARRSIFRFEKRSGLAEGTGDRYIAPGTRLINGEIAQ